MACLMGDYVTLDQSNVHCTQSQQLAQFDPLSNCCKKKSIKIYVWFGKQNVPFDSDNYVNLSLHLLSGCNCKPLLWHRNHPAQQCFWKLHGSSAANEAKAGQMVTVAADWLIKDDTHMSMHMIIIFFHNMDNTSNIPSQQMANN